MIFRLFRRLTALPKTKACTRDLEMSGSACTYSSTDTGRVKRIMVFGDSNASRPNGSNKCWPALLEDMDPLRLNVFDESCDGRTTKFDRGELNGLTVIGRKLASHSPLDYIIVLLGTNDVKSQYGPPSAAEIAEGMRQILGLIDSRATGAKPILLTPPPIGDLNLGDLRRGHSRISLLAAEYRLLAMNRDIRLVDLHSILDVGTDLEPDMIHLNAAGRRKVANAVLSNLRHMTSPPKVEGLSSIRNGPRLILTWNRVHSDTFYYRVRKNGKIIGRTMSMSFETTAPAIDESFIVEAVDFSQNAGAPSAQPAFNDSGNSPAIATSPSMTVNRQRVRSSSHVKLG